MSEEVVDLSSVNVTTTSIPQELDYTSPLLNSCKSSRKKGNDCKKTLL